MGPVSIRLPLPRRARSRHRSGGRQRRHPRSAQRIVDGLDDAVDSLEFAGKEVQLPSLPIDKTFRISAPDRLPVCTDEPPRWHTSSLSS